MTRVLKDNVVIATVAKNDSVQILSFIVSKMTLSLTSPEEVLLTEGDPLESNVKT